MASYRPFFRRRAWRTLFRGAFRYAWGRQGQWRITGLRLFYRLRMFAILRIPEPGVTSILRRSEVRIWVDGHEAFPRLEKLLAQAKHTIIIQMFIWKDDATGRRIASVLLTAADRGVQVDITKDAVGDPFELDEDFLSTSRGDAVWRRFWSHPNIRITHAGVFNHAKVYVIDDQILLLSGMNIADEYVNDWHDYLVEVRGTAFVEQFFTGKKPNASSRIALVMNQENQNDIRSALELLLLQAKESILLEQAYVGDLAIADLLAKRSKEGVRVTLILPKNPDLHHHANMQFVERLMATGNRQRIQVLMHPRFVHGKLILVDRKRLFIGSANLMTSSLDSMGEVNVLIEGVERNAIERVREELIQDIVRSKPLYTPPKLRWLGRFLASFGL